MKDRKARPPSEKDDVLGQVHNIMHYKIVRDFFEDCTRWVYVFALGGFPSGWEGYIVQHVIVDSTPDNSRIVTQVPFSMSIILNRVEFSGIQLTQVRSNSARTLQKTEEVISRMDVIPSGVGGRYILPILPKLKHWQMTQSGSTVLESLYHKPIWPDRKTPVSAVDGIGIIFCRTTGFKSSRSTNLR